MSTNSAVPDLQSPEQRRCMCSHQLVDNLPSTLASTCPSYQSSEKQSIVNAGCAVPVTSNCTQAEVMFNAAVYTCVNTGPTDGVEGRCVCAMNALQHGIPAAVVASCPSLPQTVDAYINKWNCGCGSVNNFYAESVEECVEQVSDKSAVASLYMESQISCRCSERLIETIAPWSATSSLSCPTKTNCERAQVSFASAVATCAAASGGGADAPCICAIDAMSRIPVSVKSSCPSIQQMMSSGLQWTYQAQVIAETPQGTLLFDSNFECGTENTSQKLNYGFPLR